MPHSSFQETVVVATAVVALGTTAGCADGSSYAHSPEYHELVPSAVQPLDGREATIQLSDGAVGGCEPVPHSIDHRPAAQLVLSFARVASSGHVETPAISRPCATQIIRFVSEGGQLSLALGSTGETAEQRKNSRRHWQTAERHPVAFAVSAVQAAEQVSNRLGRPIGGFTFRYQPKSPVEVADYLELITGVRQLEPDITITVAANPNGLIRRRKATARMFADIVNGFSVQP